MKPLILLSAGYETAATGLVRRYLYQNYADAVTQAGGIALLPLDSGENAAALAAMADGLLLTGGPDIDPARYGEEKLPACGSIDPRRDEMEPPLLAAFIAAGKPVFGICRGLQIINTYFGGTLWQDLPSQKGAHHSDAAHPHDCLHPTVFTPGTLLHRLYGEQCQTNSYHHQSVKTLGEGLICTARAASDEVVEALCHQTLPVWAVQWHPERMTGPARMVHQGPDSAPIFADFLERCAQAKKQTL